MAFGPLDERIGRFSAATNTTSKGNGGSEATLARNRAIVKASVNPHTSSGS